jgi:hypothetical protein
MHNEPLNQVTQIFRQNSIRSFQKNRAWDMNNSWMSGTCNAMMQENRERAETHDIDMYYHDNIVFLVRNNANGMIEMRYDAMRCDAMRLGNWRKILCFQSVCSFKCFPEGIFGIEILAGLRLPDFKLYNERIRFDGWFLKGNRKLWQNCYLNAKILLQTEVPDFLL